MDDGLGDAIRFNWKQSLLIFSPAAVCVAIYIAMTALPSYTTQRAVLILFVNFAIANITLNLMLSTMAGKSFTVAQPVIALLLLPLIAHHSLGVSAEVEGTLTFVLTWVTLALFLVRVALISIQFCDFAKITFFQIKNE